MDHKFQFQFSYPFKAQWTKINFLPLRFLHFCRGCLASSVTFVCVCGSLSGDYEFQYFVIPMFFAEYDVSDS